MQRESFFDRRQLQRLYWWDVLAMSLATLPSYFSSSRSARSAYKKDAKPSRLLPRRGRVSLSRRGVLVLLVLFGLAGLSLKNTRLPAQRVVIASNRTTSRPHVPPLVSKTMNPAFLPTSLQLRFMLPDPLNTRRKTLEIGQPRSWGH